MYACIHAPEAGALARTFSPWVEIIDPSTAVFALSPRQLAELKMLPANTGVASTIESAEIAARNLPGITYIAPGDETRLLGGLPIDCLPPDPEIFKTLDSWGIRTLADLAQLPENGLVARLGPRGALLQRLARGALDRPLKPEIPESIYEESAELDYPIKLREPLVFLLGRFLFDLAKRLKSQSLAAQTLEIKLNRQERVLRLPFPTRDVKFLIKLVEHSLETYSPDEPVEKVLLRIQPTEPRRVQHGLFTLAAPEPEKLELTLGKIRGLVGAENVIYPKVLDTYRPGSGPVESPYLAFRYFRPPLEVRVEEKVVTTKLFRGRILNIAGPWRSSGDWWRPDSAQRAVRNQALPNTADSPPRRTELCAESVERWDRDEFDLYLTDGALYRLVRDRAAGQWFAEGTYD